MERRRMGGRAVNWAGGTACVAAVVFAGVTPASVRAANVTRLFEDAAQALPKLRPPPKIQPPRVPLIPVGEGKYGIADAAVIAQLDNAKTQEVKAVEVAAAEVGRTSQSSEVEDAAKTCAKASFKRAAKDYLNAARQGTTYPAFGDVYYYAVYGCLAGHFSRAPEQSVASVASYLTGNVSAPARSAVAVAPTAFANWLVTTGNDVGASTPDSPSVTPSTSIPPEADSDGGDEGGSSFPAGLLILVGLGVLGGAGYFAYQKTK